MGIKYLRKILKEVIKPVLIEDLRGKRIGVDASLSIYQTHVDKIESSSLRGIFYKIAAFRRQGIIPVYFFDGKPPALKDAVCAARKKKIEEGNGIKIPPGTFDDVRRLLQLLNIEYIESPGEAEAQAAHATVHNFIDMVSTEDIDALPFGALKQCFGLKSNSKTVNVVMLAEVLAHLNISRQSFIDLCILLGSDYTTRTIRGVGPVSALKYIREHGSIEKILTELKLKPDEGFCFKAAREEFLNPTVMEKYPEKRLQPVYDEDTLMRVSEFLKSKNVHVDVNKLK